MKEEKPPLASLEERLKNSSSASPAGRGGLGRRDPRDMRDHRPRSPPRSPGIRASTPIEDTAAKRIKMEGDLRKSGHESDSGDKSDGDLVVDVGNEDGAQPQVNGTHGPTLGDSGSERRDRPPSNLSSSSRSTPSLKHKEVGSLDQKPGTPGSKSTTPTDQPPNKAPSPPRGPPHGPPLPGAASYPPYPGMGPRPPADGLPPGYPPIHNGPPGPPGPAGYPPRPPMAGPPSGPPGGPPHDPHPNPRLPSIHTTLTPTLVYP